LKGALAPKRVATPQAAKLQVRNAFMARRCDIDRRHSPSNGRRYLQHYLAQKRSQ
jgi:hypothetical protein